MADKPVVPPVTPTTTTTTPAAPVPAVAAAAAPPAKPPSSKPPGSPHGSGRSPIRPPRPARPVLGAKKAFGLDETPRKSMQAEDKRTRDTLRARTPVVELPPTVPEIPETPEIEVSEPVVAAPAVDTPPEPVVAAPPAKIKVGDKEYTQAEIEAKFKEGAVPPPIAAAAAQPESEPEAPPVPQLTAAEVKQREDDFLRATAESIDAPMSEQEIDLILAGGKPAIETFQAVRKRDMARAILEARKGVAAGMTPVMEQLFESIKPLWQNHQQLHRYHVEQTFLAKHKDFAPHIATARAIAEELVKRYPEQVAKMPTEQFTTEVARQTDLVLTNDHKRWFPQGDGNWRAAAAPAPVTAAPVAVPVAAAVPAPVAPAAPEPAVAVAPATAPPASPAGPRIVRPPAANAPGGMSAGAPPQWGKAVARSLRG